MNKGPIQDDERIQSLLDQINPEFIRESAREIRQADVAEMVGQATELRSKFDGPTLLRFRDEAFQVISLIEDFEAGRYQRVPYWSLAVMTFAMRYVLKPIDIIPDAVPILGRLDDALVLSQCLSMVETDLREYRIWTLATEIDRE